MTAKGTRTKKLPANDAARLRDDLLTIGSRVCHDLRTPVGGIVTGAELLQESLGESAPATKAALDSLMTSADELAQLITALGVVAKATARTYPKETVPMREVVSGVLQRLERQISEKGATVSEPVSWPEVSGVTDWLEYIWWSLLTNAVRHGGPEIQLGWTKEKKRFRFWITDNGAAISLDVTEKLFQPFETLHELGSTRGLGLSVVRRLVELQGGSCGFEEWDAGPMFHFSLPL